MAQLPHTHIVNGVCSADAAHSVPASVHSCVLSALGANVCNLEGHEGALQIRIKVNQVKDNTTNDIGAMSDGRQNPFYSYFFCFA